MPTPGAKEDKQAFISRCISMLIKKEGYKQGQATAICFSIWRKNKGGQKP